MVNELALSGLRSELDRLLRYRTADGIALRFRTLGIKGKRNRCTMCPLAVFLRQRIGCRIRVHCQGAYTGAGSIWPNGNGVALPYVVRLFVERFDNGLYPELDITKQ